MSGFIGLATLSVGFITAAAYYIFSRYVGRLLSRLRSKEAKKPRTPTDTPISRNNTHSKERPINGFVPNIKRPESELNGGLNLHDQKVIPGTGTAPSPEEFKCFIGHDVIMKFEKQRQIKYQFFVVLLASEDDLRDLSTMTFHPHHPSSSRQPLLNNQELTMPNSGCYGNYIVARFESCEYHSEEVVFGPKYDTPFSQLWSAYVRKNGGRLPKAIIMYSWNFLCSRCTELIVSILSKQPYCDVRVLTAYSRVWDSEEGYPHAVKRNKEMMTTRIGAYIQQVDPPVPLLEAGVENQAQNYDQYQTTVAT